MIQVRNNKIHAGLPLRGKVLNVYSVTEKTVLSNSELQDIMGATGLMLGQEPINLRYGKIVLLQDADPDGDSITGLLLNFFYKYWPQLFDMGIIKKYLSPIIIAKNGKDIKRFYDIRQYNEVRDQYSKYNISYNKGLGSLSTEEYSMMINNPVEYTFRVGDVCENSLKVVFGPDARLRKGWLEE